MKHIIATAILAALAGCAGPQLYAPGDRIGAQCEYESQAATAAMPNPIYAGFMQAELFQKCMRAKGR